MESPQHEGHQEQGTALTSFDRATADAVVSVLTRAGIPTWQDPEPDAHGDTVVRVAAGQREAAMREMGLRMEEIQSALRGARPQSTPPATTDRDDTSHGPPLVMERFADLRLVIVVVLAPLLAITIAGPFLPRTLRQIVFVVMATAVVAVIWRRRSR